MTVSEWQGCKRYDFSIEGRDAVVVEPSEAAPGRPWIWRPAFFGAFPSVDKALLAEGWHVAYYDVTHLYGSPRSVGLAKKFHDITVERFGLNPKSTVEGFSRGGYFAFNWAAAHPECVASVYVDAPVCDINSWPGRGSGLWQDFLDEWGINDSEAGQDFRGNAMQKLPAMAEAGIPVIAVCGAVDKVVPFADNMAVVRDAYQQMGGIVELIVKPDCDHHPHSLEDPEAVVDFLKRYAPGYSDRQQIALRGDLTNSMAAMAVRRKATVAFLGGSITEMRGWRDMVKEDLMQRFPKTEFTFIDAGIGSMGSTPHAFRFENDVLAHGTPDLLFLEAAVNDDTNHFGPAEQVKAMEGIVLHALRANPRMDIVVLDFIYDPFLPLLARGIQPDVILNHDRVANRYSLTSVNLAQEIAGRISDGQLSWEEFGGTHPAWAGHKFYAAAIAKVLDASTKPFEDYVPAEHAVTLPALEPDNYSEGRFVPIDQARLLKGGFHIDGSWRPTDGVGTRANFVDVPMLTTDRPGSFVLDFQGTAVGICCTCGQDVGTARYSIDGGKAVTLDMVTEWSGYVHIPWVYVLADGLEPGRHTLRFEVLKGERTGCHIRNFVVNGN